MDAWIIRPYPHHIDRMAQFLARDSVAIGWPGLGDLTNADKGEIRRRLDRAYSDQDDDWRRQSRATIWRFIDDVRYGDYVVVAPRVADSRAVVIGVVAGPYKYEASLDSWEQGYPHHRPVRWLTDGVVRDRLPAEVVVSMRQGTLNRTDGNALNAFLRQEKLL